MKKMSSVCISRCLSDATDPLVPVRATYVNLYKWPESDAEFLRSRSSGRSSRVVDSFSCRQMYLRSYRFSRKESVREKTVKCFGRVKEKIGGDGKRKKSLRIRRRCLVWRKIKIVLFRFFNRLLSCSATVHVVEQRNAFF
ncbi:Sulfate transporter 1.2 [Gossypium australe]|uniref:Sulfate transporter 1.2 n=1 Tax=Gossypium australe TaxID=47621 RepID=A0A5B6V6J3_9ROSI|nr:Sulfate transporter 1.2 [Gossypium australe]